MQDINIRNTTEWYMHKTEYVQENEIYFRGRMEPIQITVFLISARIRRRRRKPEETWYHSDFKEDHQLKPVWKTQQLGNNNDNNN